LTVEQWKELIFHEVIQYELQQIQTFSHGNQPIQDQSNEQSME